MHISPSVLLIWASMGKQFIVTPPPPPPFNPRPGAGGQTYTGHSYGL